MPDTSKVLQMIKGKTRVIQSIEQNDSEPTSACYREVSAQKCLFACQSESAKRDRQ